MTAESPTRQELPVTYQKLTRITPRIFGAQTRPEGVPIGHWWNGMASVMPESGKLLAGSSLPL